LGHWGISALPREILYQIANYAMVDETFEEVMDSAEICAKLTLKEWWQARHVSIADKQKYFWHLRAEYGHTSRGAEEMLNVLAGIEELGFPSKIDNLLLGAHEKTRFRLQQIMKLSRLLIYRNYLSPLAYYLRGLYGPNGESYLKIALAIDDQANVSKLSPKQRADLEFRLTAVDCDFYDWVQIAPTKSTGSKKS
jgi:hypothetical protein